MSPRRTKRPTRITEARQRLLGRVVPQAESVVLAQKVAAGKAAPTEDRWTPQSGVPAYRRTIKEPGDHQTIADKLDYVCDALGGKYFREPSAAGVRLVKLMVELGDGTRIGGAGATTAEAFDALLERAKQMEAAQ